MIKKNLCDCDRIAADVTLMEDCVCVDVGNWKWMYLSLVDFWLNSHIPDFQQI